MKMLLFKQVLKRFVRFVIGGDYVIFFNIEDNRTCFQLVKVENIVDDFSQTVAFGNDVFQKIFFNFLWHFIVVQKNFTCSANRSYWCAKFVRNAVEEFVFLLVFND